MRTIHPFLLAKKIPFTCSNPQVIHIMSQIRIGYHDKERLRLQSTRTRNKIASCWSQTSTKENLQIKPSQVEALALNGGWHAWATTTKLMRFFSICFTKCFRNKSESLSEIKIKIFQNENAFIWKKFAK